MSRDQQPIPRWLQILAAISAIIMVPITLYFGIPDLPSMMTSWKMVSWTNILVIILFVICFLLLPLFGLCVAFGAVPIPAKLSPIAKKLGLLYSFLIVFIYTTGVLSKGNDFLQDSKALLAWLIVADVAWCIVFLRLLFAKSH